MEQAVSGCSRETVEEDFSVLVIIASLLHMLVLRLA